VIKRLIFNTLFLILEPGTKTDWSNMMIKI
jgi:hypothetical protein